MEDCPLRTCQTLGHCVVFDIADFDDHEPFFTDMSKCKFKTSQDTIECFRAHCPDFDQYISREKHNIWTLLTGPLVRYHHCDDLFRHMVEQRIPFNGTRFNIHRFGSILDKLAYNLDLIKPFYYHCWAKGEVSIF